MFARNKAWSSAAGAAWLLIAVAINGPHAARAETSDASTPPLELAGVDVTRVEPRDIASDVRISGSLTPIRRSTLAARVASTIVELPVKVGDVVRKGDLLVRFDTRALESTLTVRRASAEALAAQLQLAESVLRRTTNLGQSGASTEAATLEAEANVANLAAQLRSKRAEIADAERDLADAEVRAVFDGVVASRPVEQDQTVALNTELLTIVDLSRMEVDAGVPTSRIPMVRVGQPVELNVEGFPDRTFSGAVTRISPTAVAGSRAVRVFLAIDNNDRTLKGGMFTTGILKVDERKGVIALPNAAIRQDQTGSFVLKVTEGVLRRQPVVLGTAWTDRGLVEVSGPAAGDVVVSAPLPALEADMPVVVEGL
ncbi:efflux RND transporter periplasmic adaptor subunit [Shinella sp. 838]|jgi:RND family efflux transporter MFP subunit|uniref:efflux RND transporter periplasmic adaptor subunit n=1 Tax=unclassified Shinella TaxID=2643062 RepID=UPI0003C53651|nr:MULTISPECIES: efflux RND transporter periplasmic adaptor subunit [unclassified Shinella]EYR82914.1 nodulation protein NolF [Shinella sp. DD12]MDG4673384.1 efflux RND transporter periplasmic adaptor subunit [Shinella sp. 838]